MQMNDAVQKIRQILNDGPSSIVVKGYRAARTPIASHHLNQDNEIAEIIREYAREVTTQTLKRV